MADWSRPDNDDPRNEVIETTADLMPEMAVPISQYGRLNVISMHSGLFETSIAAVSQNLDGSIASAGAQSSNAAAAGFVAATAIANAQASAAAARNTAIGAINTAATSRASLMDTLSKSISDCYTANAAAKANGDPQQQKCQ